MLNTPRTAGITRRNLVGGALWLGAVGRASGAEAVLPVAEVDHVNIRVRDVRRSAAFYGQLFGAEMSSIPKYWANPGSTPGELWFLKLGQSHLSISPSSREQGPGLDHFSRTRTATSSR